MRDTITEPHKEKRDEIARKTEEFLKNGGLIETKERKDRDQIIKETKRSKINWHDITYSPRRKDLKR